MRITAADVQVVIDWVDRAKRGVAANVTTTQGTRHRLGHLPAEGWFCTCPKGKRCPQIEHVKQLVPEMEKP